MNQGSTRRPGYGLTLRSRAMPALFGAGPFALLQQLDDNMNQLFEEFGSARLFGSGGPGEAGLWSPQVEMCERDGKLHVYADLPGMAKDDIKVDIDAGRLTIEGERRSTNDDKAAQQGRYHSERSYGSFYRSIPLPEGIDADTAQASFRDGVLDVCFDAPSARTQQKRTLQVEDGPTQHAGASADAAGSDRASSAASDGASTTAGSAASGTDGADKPQAASSPAQPASTAQRSA